MTEWPSGLGRVREAYVALKRRRFPTLADGDAGAGLEGEGAARERLLLHAAAARTLEAGAARQVIEGVVGGPLDGGEDGGARLLGLVGDEERARVIAAALRRLGEVAEREGAGGGGEVAGGE